MPVKNLNKETRDLHAREKEQIEKKKKEALSIAKSNVKQRKGGAAPARHHDRKRAEAIKKEVLSRKQVVDALEKKSKVVGENRAKDSKSGGRK